jgi:bacteriorhodopsin
MSSSGDMLSQLRNPAILLGVVSVIGMIVLGLVIVQSGMDDSHQFVAYIIMAGAFINVVWAIVKLGENPVKADENTSDKS